MSERLLKGLKALDLTDAKGFVCGKNLAVLGVDVIKIERPQGDVERLYPPFHEDKPGKERSLYWKSFNTDKRAITLDITQAVGRELFLRLVEDVDFIIESFEPGYLRSLGLGFDDLRAHNPRLVMVSISPFGQSGAYSQFKGSELIAVAMGGVLGNTGDPDRSPVKESLESTYFHAGAAAALGALIAYYHVIKGGIGQQVDVSLQETAASRMTSAVLAWQFERLNLKRQGDKSQLGPIATTWFWPCKDGHLFWHMLGGLHGAPANKALTEWINEYVPVHSLQEVNDWRKFDKAGISQEQWNSFEEVIRPFFMRFTKEEIRKESLERGVNAAVANSADEVMHSEQLNSRGYWARIEDSELGVLSYPKYLFKSTGSENFSETPAPKLGADNAEIFGTQLGLSKDQINELKEANVI
jgi:benzylsuccinate CoA-transferase BbsE subunit